MLRFLVAFLVLSTTSIPATADWLNVYNKDEFDGKDRYFAITSAQEPLFGFVCDAETARVRLFYKTKERTTRELRDALPAFASIAVIVDDQPVRSHPGRMFDVGRKISAESFHDSIDALAKALATAKRRVLVAIDWRGQKAERNEFKVAGAGQAIKQVFDKCATLKPR